MRSTEISRRAHGLEAPQQQIVVIRDPLDTTRTRRFLALESDLDPKFVNNQPMGLFNEEQYFRQLVASLLRVDKDLSGSNVFGNVVADAGPAGVFNRASGLRDYQRGLPSMEDQALINLLGIRGGAKRAFAESTLGMMAGLTPQQYHQRMLAEIQKVLPRLKETIASFRLTDPTEVGIYDDMIRRLEAGLGVDWSKFHAIHSAVKPAKPKAPTQAAPQNLANGGMVRGPGGPKDDAIPANLSNGEAVIDAATVKKNPGIIAALFQKKRIKLPGYSESNGREFFSFGPDKDVELGGRDPAEVRKILGELRNVTALIEGMDEVLYQALVRLGKKINPSNLKKMLNEDPALELLRSPVVGKGRKTGSQGAVKMHAGGAVLVTNIEDLRGVVSEATMKVLKDNNVTQARLLQDLVFGGPAAANKEKLTGQEFAGTLDSDEGKDAFMRYVAEAGNIPPNHPDLRRFAEAVRQKLLAAGTNAVTDPMFAQIIQEALAEEIDDVGKNTTQVVKDAFTEAKRYSAISAKVYGAAGRDLKLLPNQTFSVGDQEVESIRRSTNYTETGTPVADDILFDNATLGITKERAIAAGHEIGRIFAITAGEAAIDAARANSPSRETINASESLVDGVTTTIVNAKDDVAASVEQMLSPMTDSKGRLIRRYTDDAEKQADINTRNLQASQATTDAANIAQGKPRGGYRSASREGDLEARQRQQAEAGLVSESDKERVNAFSNNLSKASLAIGSITGIMSVFGADLGGIAPVISMVSSALFTLSMISQQLAGTKIAEAISGRALQVVNTMGAKTMEDLFVKGAGLGGFLSNFGNGLKFVLRFIGPIGIGLGSLAISFSVLSKIAEDQKAKIKGLGDAAFLTAEKMKLAGSLLGFTPKEIDFAASFTRPEGITAEQATSASSVAKDETFFKKDFFGNTDTTVGFGKEIEAIKNATVQEAQLALEAIALRTLASGGDAEAVAILTGAILEAADRKELSLDIVTNIDLATPEGEAKLSEIGAGASKLVSDALSTGFNPANGFNDEQQRAINQASGTYATLFSALRSGLENSTISSETFNQQMEILRGQLASMDPAALNDIGPAISEALGVGQIFAEINGGLLTAEDRILAITAATAGIPIDTTDIKLIIDGYGSAIPDAIAAADEARDRWRAGAVDNAAIVEETNILDALNTELDAIDAKIVANDAQIAMAEKLIASGLDEADALAAVTDETWNNIFAKAAEADLLAGTTDATDKAIDSYNSLKESTEELTDAQNRASYADWKAGILEQNDALNQLTAAGVPTATAIQIVNDAAARTAAITALGNGNLAAWLAEYNTIQAMASKISGSVGGGQKSAFQEAIDSLKEQQKEAKDSITAYAKLRSAGLGVAEASEIAKDSMLAAALASQQVGSRKWNQLVTAIRAARAEEQAWLNSTPEGRTQIFEDVYDKVMDVFSAQEAVLEANTKAATKVNRDLIKSLEKQIDAYNRRSSELQRDLDEIAEKESEINKAYDEKTKALETVKKLNQDIINQQKSQISIADALSRGDVSAAASAMQDARAQSAAAQGDAMGTALDASRQSQLDALTQNGKTRAEIEAEIKQIKKDVAAIEFGALQTARDAVEAAEEDLEIKKTSLMVAGQTKEQIELAKANIDLAKASAQGYDGELQNALASVTGIVEQWRALGTTFTTTHRINTIVNPGSPSPATSTARVAGGGYISGPGTATSDSIPAMLSDGEYVIKAASVNKFGKNFLDSINAGRLPGFRLGGMIRDGGGSSKSSTPSKAGVARKTSAASAKPAATPQPSAIERALPIILNAAKSMPIISDQMQGIEMGKSLVNLVTGKATGGDYATLGLGALSFIPGGKAVSTGVKAAKQANSIIPNIKKLFSSDPNVLQPRQFSQALSNAAIVTRRSQSSVESMLRGNNVKTLFDTGTSGGSTSQAMRANLEQSLFGKDNIEKISYGILANKKGLTANLPFFKTRDMFDPFQTSILQYGDTLLNLKKSAFKKTSLTAGDSLNNFERGLKPNENFLTQSLALANKKDVASKFKAHPMQQYVEAQIRGLNPRTDIKNIWASDAKSAKELSAVVKELGLRIPVKISPSNAQRETQTVLGNTLRGLKDSMLNPKTAKNRFDLFKKQNFNLKEYNPFTGKLGKDADMRINTLAKGGLATNKFAMGGLVSPKYFAMGGLVSPKYFADGGMAKGTDTVPSMLTPGEFVVNKKATDLYGPLLAAMNSSPAASLSMMGAKTFSEPVYNMPSREYADVGGSSPININSSSPSSSLTSNDNSVYNNNYSVSVNVDGTNASANDIANVVINKIRTIDSQQVRRQVLR
jgi:hypothetical protein